MNFLKRFWRWLRGEPKPVYSVKQVKQIEPIHGDYWLINIIWGDQILSFSTEIKREKVFCRLVNKAVERQLGDKYKSVRPYRFRIDSSINTITYMMDSLYSKEILSILLSVLFQYMEDETKAYLRDTISQLTIQDETIVKDITKRPSDHVPDEYYLDVVHNGITLKRYIASFFPNGDKINHFSFLMHCMYCEDDTVTHMASVNTHRIEARYHDHLLSVAQKLGAIVFSKDHFGPVITNTIFDGIPSDMEAPKPHVFNIKQCRNGYFIYANGGLHV